MAKKPTGHLTRRTLLATAGKATVVALAAPFLDLAVGAAARGRGADRRPLNAVAGVDRVVMLHGKTYLSAWAGYGAAPQRGRRPSAAPGSRPRRRSGRRRRALEQAVGPGHGDVCRPGGADDDGQFSEPGEYVLQVAADNGSATAASTLR